MKKTKWWAIILAFAVLAGIIWVLPDAQGLSPAGKKSLAIATFAIIIWITQAIDDALSGIVIVFLLAALKATNLAGAFSGYSNTSLWLIVIGFIMAGCMEKSGLSKRIALFMINAAKGSASKIYWAVAAVIGITTFLVPSITARTLLMLPIILGIGHAFKSELGKSNIIKALLFIVAMSGTMMSCGVLTGHVGNPATAGLIEAATKQTVTWSEWFRIGAFPAFSMAFLSVFVIKWLWAPEIKQIPDAKAYVENELASIGSFSSKEKYTLLVFIITLLLWATDSLHKVNVAIVGLLAVALLIWPSIGVMPWKEAQQKVPWNVFMLYGAGLSMGVAMVTSGAAKWLAGTLLAPIVSFSIATQIIILIWIVTVLQVFFTGGGPKTTALTPIVLAHAVTIGADPLIFALILGMNMQHQYILPVSNMPNAVAIGTGHIQVNEMIRTGIVMSIFAAAYMSIMVKTTWTWMGLVP